MSVQTKSTLKTALAEALYNEILTNTSQYYYFLGRTTPEWPSGATSPETPYDSLGYEIELRRDIIYFKKINQGDVSFIVPRYDWTSGVVYDMYDDSVGEVYTVAATGATSSYNLGTATSFDLTKFGQGWLVTDAVASNIDSDTLVSSATSSNITLDKLPLGAVTSINLTKITDSGSTTLQGSRFYVMTSDYNVYKCLFNNNGAASTVQPTGTSYESFSTSDGYVWKYMCTIPRAFINKFLTSTDMPVTTATKNFFYSNGSLNVVEIFNQGSGYSSGDSLVVNGDGYLASNPYKIIGINIDAAGSGYTTSPTLTIDDPVAVGATWAASTDYLDGKLLKTTEGNIYKVIASGQTDSTEPTYTGDSTFSDNNATLKFVGRTASATATTDGDLITSASLNNGIVGFVNITNVGSGYESDNPPSVTITGDGTGATATATVASDGTISKINLTDRGSGYSYATATIGAPTLSTQIVFFLSGVASQVDYTNNTITFPNHGFATGDEVTYTKIAGKDGIGGLTNATSYFVIAEDEDVLKLAVDLPNAKSRTAIDFTEAADPGIAAYLTLNTTQAVLDVEVYYGYGYTSQPSVTITGGGGSSASITVDVEKTEALITPIIVGGQIVATKTIDGGEGYTYAVIIPSSTTGTGADIRARFEIGDLNTQQAITEMLAINGGLHAIEILHGGAYDDSYAVPGVVITGDGSGATGIATVSGDVVTKVTMTDVGSGYTTATVSFSGSTGTGAVARAILSPYGGHGKNAIRELYAEDLAVVSRIHRDKIGGFNIVNDYRQTGIIKNPYKYSDDLRFALPEGTTCFIFTSADFIYGNIDLDETLTDASGNEFYVVAKQKNVASTGDYVSLLVVSSTNNAPVAGDTITYDNTSAVLDAVTNPDIDKYSGDLLFLDNQLLMEPKDNQPIALNTIIRF